MFFIHSLWTVNSERWTVTRIETEKLKINNKRKWKFRYDQQWKIILPNNNENFINRIFITMHIFIMKCFFSHRFDWFSILSICIFKEETKEIEIYPLANDIIIIIIFSRSIDEKYLIINKSKGRTIIVIFDLTKRWGEMEMVFRLQGPRIHKKNMSSKNSKTLINEWQRETSISFIIIITDEGN